ncbi:RING finger protein [Plasmodium coatneyi]|uniref:RING finger protein n=1 Tax=Plasmodium coatneyi TaxID=208452 RepID=A0A1B1DVN7_9APIC|nr:RING finger protein [Plasmodium coatneyi]ANQ06804.1 RING finger protein [Plasmodium coatneyi]
MAGPYPRRNGNSSQSNNLIATLSEMQIDADYIQQLRWNIKTKVDILMSKLFPITRKKEEKRFIVIIEKNKNYDNFRCPICMLILYKPVKTKCGHMFCKECIEHVLKKFDYCPMCRENIKEFKLEPVQNSLLGKEYTDIKIRCWKCREITDIEHYEAHLESHVDDGDEGGYGCWRGSGVPTCLVTDTTLGRVSCIGKAPQADPTETLIRALSPFFNKRINVANRDEFVKAVRENQLNTDIHSVHLLFGKRVEKETPNGREAKLGISHGSQSGNPNLCPSTNPPEQHGEMINMDDITWDAFILVQIKWEKKKQIYKSDAGDDDKVYSSMLPSSTGDLKGGENMDDSLSYKKDQPTDHSRRNILYTLDNFEAYQKRKLKKNKTNKYFYVLLEYNAKGLFFTPMKNIPVFKDMNMERSVIYRGGDKRWDKHNMREGKREDTSSQDEQLIDILVKMNEKIKSRTYHKYLYNAVHLFHEFLNWYSSIEQSDTKIAVKRTHFRKNQLEDLELMLLLFYLKYECTMPENVDYGAMYSCATFLNKVMSSAKETNQAVFVTDVYTYRSDAITRGKHRPGGGQTNKSNSLAALSSVSLRKADVNIHFVLRVRRGKPTACEDQQAGVGAGAAHHQVKEQPSRNLQNYDDVTDLCYLLLCFSDMGFQWDVNESLDFSKTKKSIPYKEINVLFSMDKLILCLFNVRRKKYSPLFWNSAHLLQYLLHFCAD